MLCGFHAEAGEEGNREVEREKQIESTRWRKRKTNRKRDLETYLNIENERAEVTKKKEETAERCEDERRLTGYEPLLEPKRRNQGQMRYNDGKIGAVHLLSRQGL